MQDIQQQAPADASAAALPLEATAKADLGKRFLAMLIDAVAAAILGAIPKVGLLLAPAYWLSRDGLALDFMDGRSLGKKVMKLRPVRLDGGPMDLATSARRNWMYALGVVGMVPMIGIFLLIPAGIAGLGIGIYEVIKVFTDERGRRLGDDIAGTVVVEVAD